MSALLNPDDVSTLLGLSKGHLAHLRQRGEGPAYVKLGTAVRYRLSDVEDFISAARIKTAGGGR